MKTASRLTLALLLLLTGCSVRLGDLTVASAKNQTHQFEVLQRNVEGEDCILMILGLIPIGSLRPSLDEAMDRAVEKVPNANVMMNVTVKSTVLYPILFMRSCLVVKGDVGRL